MAHCSAKGIALSRPQKCLSFGGPNTFGDASTSKQAGKIPLGNRPDSPKSGISVGAAPAGLRVGQLKMDMPPVFTASRQQNVRGWLTKMERYFRLMRYPTDTWIEVVATRLTEAAEAWFNGESQRIETGARRAWRSWAAFSQEMIAAFEPMTEMETGKEIDHRVEADRSCLRVHSAFSYIEVQGREHDGGGNSLAVSSRDWMPGFNSKLEYMHNRCRKPWS